MNRLNTNQRRPRTARVVRLSTVIAMFGACVALAACGGSSSSGSNGSAGASNKGSQQETAQLKLTECLREHGVNIPDSANRAAAIQGLANVPQSTVQTAMSACRKYASGSSVSASSRAQGVQRREQVLSYARCLREHGLNVPEPTPTTSGGIPAFLQALHEAQQSPTFTKANQTCQQKLPKGFAGGG